MADPLSITVGIIAVLQTAAKAVTYLSDVKNATTERQQILIEISTINGFLHTLKALAEKMQPGNTHVSGLRALNEPNGPLDQFKSTLEDLMSRLERPGKLKNLSKVLTWTLDKREVKNILEQLERQKAYFLLAMQSDHM